MKALLRPAFELVGFVLLLWFCQYYALAGVGGPLTVG